MKKIIELSLVLTVVLSLSACNQWLDIPPKGQVDAKELLTDVKGYNAAINGVYSIMTSNALYGKEMTYGVMDVYAQYWKIAPSHLYAKAVNYERDYTISYSNGFWSEMYRAIGQCNQILESYKETGNTIENSNLFKGEALGLRGFMHLELLKMFGPVLRTTADYAKAAIPYRKNYNNIAIKFNTATEVLNFARADLLAALVEFENDPINVNGRVGNGNTSRLDYSSVIDRRGNRMNVWAVKAILARLEMIAGNKTTALEYCEDIIANGIIFTFNSRFNATEETFRDLNCSTELIFSLYSNNLYQITAGTFGFDEVRKESTKHLLIEGADFPLIQNNIYGRSPDGSGADYRLKHWFMETFDKRQDLAKLRAPKTGPSMTAPYLPEVSIVKLPEIYYMAAECLVGVDNVKAMNYINTVRIHRGLTAMEGSFSDDDVTRNIFREYKKEFIGEGILFGYYKRHDKNIEAIDGSIIQASDNVFVFKIPDEEYEFSPNKKPSAN